MRGIVYHVIFWEGFITTDRELFYMFPFLAGMELSRRGILNKLAACCKQDKKNRREFLTYSIVILLILGVMRTQISLIADTFYAASIIAVGIGIASFENGVVKVLDFLGRHSMNIFLIHSMVYYYFAGSKMLLEHIHGAVIKYAVLIFICLGCSVLVENIKGYVHKIWNQHKILKGIKK